MVFAVGATHTIIVELNVARARDSLAEEVAVLRDLRIGLCEVLEQLRDQTLKNRLWGLSLLY